MPTPLTPLRSTSSFSELRLRRRARDLVDAEAQGAAAHNGHADQHAPVAPRRISFGVSLVASLTEGVPEVLFTSRNLDTGYPCVLWRKTQLDPKPPQRLRGQPTFTLLCGWNCQREYKTRLSNLRLPS